MATTDYIGNKLHKGDTVQLWLEKPYVLGRIVSLEEGGILRPMPGVDPRQAPVTPCVIVIQVETTLVLSPDSRVKNLLVVKEPKEMQTPEGLEKPS